MVEGITSSRRGWRCPGRLRCRLTRCRTSAPSSAACGPCVETSSARRHVVRHGIIIHVMRHGIIRQGTYHMTRDKTRDKTRDTTRDKAAAYMWAEILAPDAASGCPSATAPPHVLNFSVGKSSAFWQDSAWAANASLISICNWGNTYSMYKYNS